MLWITLTVAALLSLIALAYVIAPLVKPGPAVIVVEDERLTELIGRKDALLTAIKELDFDYQVGKLSEEDYRRFDERLRRQAIGLLQQIEKAAPESADLDQMLEAEIARRRKTRDRTIPMAQEQASLRQPAAIAKEGKVRFCTNCGQPLGSHHKFCANCGAPASA
jgi:rubrerythrin